MVPSRRRYGLSSTTAGRRFPSATVDAVIPVVAGQADLPRHRVSTVKKISSGSGPSSWSGHRCRRRVTAPTGRTRQLTRQARASDVYPPSLRKERRDRDWRLIVIGIHVKFPFSLGTRTNKYTVLHLIFRPSLLVEQVMSQEPYRSARRVFWIMDKVSFIVGKLPMSGLSKKWKIYYPCSYAVHASWLNQVEIYFSVLQRKVITPSDFNSLSELETRILTFRSIMKRSQSPSNGNLPAKN